jgi:hypothetical protein
MALCAILLNLMCLFVSPEPQAPNAMSAAEQEAIEKSVLDTFARMTAAGESRDIDRLFSFMLETEKGSIVQNGAILRSRSEALRQTKQNLSGIRSIAYRWKQQLVTVVAPTVALLIADGESSVTTEQGDSFTAPFVQSIVFVLADGHWKALHAHQSSPRR